MKTPMIALAALFSLTLLPAAARADERPYGYGASYDASPGYDYYASPDSSWEQPSEQAMFGSFWTGLSPYGRWEWAPQYGWIWRPAQVGFRPYSEGRWVYTDYGWTFVSEQPYGWAVFHYGRWIATPTGWAWVPGYAWAPAWVSFREVDGYVGWSPLGPGDVVYDWQPAHVHVSGSPWVFVSVNLFGSGPIRVTHGGHSHHDFYRRSRPVTCSWHAGTPVYRELPRVHRAAPVRIYAASEPSSAGWRDSGVAVYRFERPRAHQRSHEAQRWQERREERRDDRGHWREERREHRRESVQAPSRPAQPSWAGRGNESRPLPVERKVQLPQPPARRQAEVARPIAHPSGLRVPERAQPGHGRGQARGHGRQE